MKMSNVWFFLILMCFIATTSCAGKDAVSGLQEDDKEEILSHIRNMDTVFLITCENTDVTAQEVKDAIGDVCEKENYYRWLWTDVFIQMQKKEDAAEIRFFVKYIMTKKQQEYIDYNIPIIESKLVTGKMTEEDKIKALTVYVRDSVSFKLDESINTPYNAMTAKVSSCLGYSMLLDRLLKTAGISSEIMTGKYKSESHVWNKIIMDGGTFYIDSSAQREYCLCTPEDFKELGYSWDE